MASDASIVITALGLACSLGTSPEEAFEAIVAGRCGIGGMSALEQAPAPDKGGGQAKDLPEIEPASAIREVRYLRHVIAQAMASAGPPRCDPRRISAIMGTTLHGMRAAGRWMRSGDLAELLMFPAGAVLEQALRGSGIGGERLSTCSACSSGLGAIAMGVTLLRAGAADMVIAGGYDTVSEYVYAGFDSLRLVAEGPPRPFGAARDGMKTAEGYGVVVLEREPDAALRGARVRGYVAGFGESADAHHLTQPHPEGKGARAAIDQALGRAGLGPRAIGLVSAHATATPGNDSSEYAALRGVFGNVLSMTPVVAFKGHLGHTLGGAGAVELVLAVLARERGVVPSTLNGSPTDPAFTELRLNHGRPAAAQIDATLNLSLGFGGANTCVVVTSARPSVSIPLRDEAVITGVGIVFPGAIGNERFVEALRGGKDSLAGGTGRVGEDAIAHLLNSRRVRRMSEYVKLTLAASTVACAHAGIEDAAAFAENACVLLGTMHGSSNFCEEYYSQIVREGIAGANPVLFAEGVPNAAAAQLSLMLGVRGGCQTIIGNRTAGLDALRLATLRIREGVWIRAFVGAAEELCETVNRATAQCREQDLGGFTSGAVMLTVESRRAAEARGARVFATVGEGWSVSGSAPEVVAASRQIAASVDVAVSALGDGRFDRLFGRAMSEATGDRHWSIRPWLPECFSSGGLAALAGLLLGSEAIPEMKAASWGSGLVVGTEFSGGASGVVLRR